MEKLFLKVALNSLVGRTYLMVTLKSNNHCISALCNLVGRTYLMVTLKFNNHCISALCNLVGRTYLMVALKSNNHCISAFCNLVRRTYLGPVVRTPVSTNLRLNFNPGFFFLLSKALSRISFFILFRISNHQIVGREN